MIAAMLIACAPALAQKAARVDPAPPPVAAPETAPPYEPQLLRLAELMGALAYMRDLCGAHDGELWRTKMAALMDAEAKSDVRRERLAGAYNHGFRGYQTSYRACTANAGLVITRYLEEGERLVRELGNRYGGG